MRFGDKKFQAASLEQKDKTEQLGNTTNGTAENHLNNNNKKTRRLRKGKKIYKKELCAYIDGREIKKML